MTGEAPRNRLGEEVSPYLRQHACNPVHWEPWDEAALARAAREGKPVFLSIGYAACHWCHVMEHESFADATTAGLLNRAFVAIKVDREERPDLDAVYMAAVQAMTGSGGWPLSVFLTPDGRPFFGGTYFPPERRWGRPSFTEVLAAVAAAWAGRRGDLEHQAAALTASLAQPGSATAAELLDLRTADRRAMAALGSRFDRRWGGFGEAPKFPTPSRLFFLLGQAPADPVARTMLAATLEGMAAGGMWDWLGGGFHRYSVDAQWLVPHFEKMLYDNALLARVYGEAGIRLGVPGAVDVARTTADYLIGEMQGEDGGFSASTDADSDGGEGLAFTWTAPEVRAAAPGAAGELLVALCALDGPARCEDGRHVLRPALALDDAARRAGIPEDRAQAVLTAARTRLLAARRRRTPPPADEKRVAAWNGMAVWALAWLGAALGTPAYTAAAHRAASFLRRRIAADGRVDRSFCAGRASGAETLEDVAWVARGLLALGALCGDASMVDVARETVARRLPHYTDDGGGVLEAPDDGPPLLFRPSARHDGATPAAAAVVADTLLDLAAVTGDDRWQERAERLLSAGAGEAARWPEACTSWIDARRRAGRPPLTVAVVSGHDDAGAAALVATALRCAPPGTAVAVRRPGDGAGQGIAPWLAATATADAATAHVCSGTACQLPVSTAAELAARLGQ